MDTVKITDLPQNQRAEISMWAGMGVAFAREHNLPFPLTFDVGKPGEQFRFTIEQVEASQHPGRASVFDSEAGS